MHYTIERLLSGDAQVSVFYERARQHWQEILEGQDLTDSSLLAAIAGREQHWFEAHCGGRYLGQEVMAVSALAQFYTTARGFGDDRWKAEALGDAFQRSSCSVEVKYAVEDALHSYLR